MSNLYGENNPTMLDSGTLWRCGHGHTKLGRACWRCGIFHPIRFARDLWLDLK